MRLQVETRSKDGIITIKPGLVSEAMKPVPAFTIAIPEKPGEKCVPFLFSDSRLPWTKPAALDSKPSHVILCGDFVWIAVNNMLVILSAATGRRVRVPTVIGECKFLVGTEEVVLAAGSKCFVFDVATAKLVQTMPIHSQFQEYDVSRWPMVIARTGTREWCWGVNEGAWIGGIERIEYGELSMSEILSIAEETPELNMVWKQEQHELTELWLSQCEQ